MSCASASACRPSAESRRAAHSRACASNATDPVARRMSAAWTRSPRAIGERGVAPRSPRAEPTPARRAAPPRARARASANASSVTHGPAKPAAGPSLSTSSNSSSTVAPRRRRVARPRRAEGVSREPGQERLGVADRSPLLGRAARRRPRPAAGRRVPAGSARARFGRAPACSAARGRPAPDRRGRAPRPRAAEVERGLRRGCRGTSGAPGAAPRPSVNRRTRRRSAASASLHVRDRHQQLRAEIEVGPAGTP